MASIPDLYRKRVIATIYLFSIQNECHGFYEAAPPTPQNSVLMTRKAAELH